MADGAWVSMQVQWRQGDVVREVWVAVSRQTLHPHMWVRGAAARLLGLAFADAAIGELFHWGCAISPGEWLQRPKGLASGFWGHGMGTVWNCLWWLWC